ncbi:hypothetical protein BH11BAC5_BH11BAC5_50650 [soil metagenome]|jgi:hypothetical protein
MHDILEHKILELLYRKPTLSTSAYQQGEGRVIAVYKRHYKTSYLEFGILVDLLNNPIKYVERPEGIISFNQLIANRDEVEIKKYNWFEVSEAIEVLTLNEQVTDSFPDDPFNSSSKREICLTPKGAIDFRNKFYIKIFEKEETQKLELSAKRNWLRNDLIKFMCTATLGAALTLVPKLFETKTILNEQKPFKTIADTTILKSKTNSK